MGFTIPYSFFTVFLFCNYTPNLVSLDKKLDNYKQNFDLLAKNLPKHFWTASDRGPIFAKISFFLLSFVSREKGPAQ